MSSWPKDVLREAEEIVNGVLSHIGLVLLRRAQSPYWDIFSDILKQKNIFPATIFDIGVAEGTPALYKAFPDALYYLVEPTREAQPFLDKWEKKLNAKVLNVALGAEEGTAMIDVRDKIAGSSLFSEVGHSVSKQRYEVPVRRFDAVFEHIERPSLCKIDVQGAELAVIEGMIGKIDEIDIIIVEVSSIATLRDAPELFEVVRRLNDLGFVVYDVLGMLRRPLDQALAQLDLAFVRADSPLRADRRWMADP